jgi:hypothetical protein
MGDRLKRLTGITEESVYWAKTCEIIFWKQTGQLRVNKVLGSRSTWIPILVLQFTNYKPHKLLTFFELQFLHP